MAEQASSVLCEGVRGVVAAMRSYPAQRSLLPWQDMFVDLVQGRLQNLFLSLLACESLSCLASLWQVDSLVALP